MANYLLLKPGGVFQLWETYCIREYCVVYQNSLSRLPPKSVPLLVRAAVDVTGLHAIATPPLIFHLFCLVFLYTGFTSPHNYYVYLALCSLYVCVRYCLLSRLTRFRLVSARFYVYLCFVASGTLFVVLCAALIVLGIWCW